MLGSFGCHAENIPNLVLAIRICCDDRSVLAQRLDVGEGSFQRLSFALIVLVMEDSCILFSLVKDCLALG